MLPASHKNPRFTLPSLTGRAFPPGLGRQVKVSAQALPHDSPISRAILPWAWL